MGPAISYYQHKSSQTTLDWKSFDLFKICEDLEEVSIIKSVPNYIYYLHEFSKIFIHFLSMFLAWKSVFGNF
jgi:hypothetical protein